MAPPINRRAGYSRKAQLKIFTSYLLAFTGALAGLLLLALSWFDPSAFATVRNGVADVTSPATSALAATRDGLKTGWEETSAYFKAGSQNAELKRELKQTRSKAIRANAVEQENKRLKKLLGLVQQNERPVAITRLVNSASSSTRQLATINIGSQHNIQAGQPVLSEEGLIGRILDTGRYSARVLMLGDTETIVPAQRDSDGVIAFSQGRGDGLVDLKLIRVGINPLKKGDIFVTSGNGGLYPPNIPLARVVRLTSDGAIGEPLAWPAATNFVIIRNIYIPPPKDESDNAPETISDQAGEASQEAE